MGDTLEDGMKQFVNGIDGATVCSFSTAESYVLFWHRVYCNVAEAIARKYLRFTVAHISESFRFVSRC